MADARAVLVRPHARPSTARRSDFRTAAHVLSVHAAGAGAHLRLADDARRRSPAASRSSSSSSAAARARSDAAARHAARRAAGPGAACRAPSPRCCSLLAVRVYLGRFDRLFDDADDLHRRHLHRRPRHADRPADRRRSRSCVGGAHRARQRGLRARASAGSSRPSCRRPSCYVARVDRRLVRQQLHRQAERAGARAARTSRTTSR